MRTYIVLLRGINVGGHKKLPMVELRELLSNSGFESVRTYIQSGNVILESDEESFQNIEDIIQKAIFNHFGFEVSILVRTRQELQAIIDNCPFSEEKMRDSYFMILHTIPDKNLIESVSHISYPNEEFIITNSCLYFYCSMGYGNVKFNGNLFERKLKTAATTRNYRTMVKLLSLSEDVTN